MTNNDSLLEVYNILAENGLQTFFSAFCLQLQINKKEDLLGIYQTDLHRIGIVSRLSIKSFEDIILKLKQNEYKNTLKTHERLSMYVVDLLIINQEPVIISTHNVEYREPLGAGHFGKVYKALWNRKHNGEDLAVPVAIKTLTDGTEMSWKKEVSIFTALNQNHSCIIKFFGLLVSEQDEVKMVTEFATYGSLLDQLRGRRITSVAILCQFAVQIATGMVFLHSKNLVHRDLSARNILVTALNQVKISDFGLSKILSESEGEWVMESNEMLPMRWLAPESYNSGIFTTSSDVWSFAVVLWEMFTFGNVPWDNLNNDQVKDKVENGERLPEPNVCPGGVYDIMVTCFCKDGRSRPPFHVIRDELLKNQPETLIAIQDEHSRQHLNFKTNDYVTAIKQVNNDLWLGQHEKTLLFGDFNRSTTASIDYMVPLDKNERNFNSSRNNHVEETKKTEPLDQVYRPVEVDATVAHKHEDNSLGESKVAENILYEKASEFEKPKRAERIRSYEIEKLKSHSDSKLFQNTKPEVQETVNNRIAVNMQAFFSVTGNKENHCHILDENISPNGYLLPVDVSVQPSLITIINQEDPFPRLKAASQENIYEEIATPPLRRKYQSSETIIERPRPKPRISNTVLDHYADSVKRDLLRFSEASNKPNQLSNETSVSSSMNERKIPTKYLNGSEGIKNHEYMQKYSHVILPNHREKLQNRNISNNGQTHLQRSNPNISNIRVKLETKERASSCDYADYFSNQKEGKQKKDFRYDVDDAMCSRLADLPITAKERAKRAVTNYTNNDWHLFEDCVKDSKRLDRKQTSAEDISWPQDMNNLSQRKKEKFSEKFQSIRQILPGASVSDCLDALRYSQNKVTRAVKYIRVLTLTRFNFGYSFEECERLFEDHNENYEAAEKSLKISYVVTQFGSLDKDKVRELLQLSQWDINKTLKTIFLQNCRDIGVPDRKGETILVECGHQVKKALEIVKIIRLAEISGKSEHLCFKVLTHCGWNIERAVEHIFNE